MTFDVAMCRGAGLPMCTTCNRYRQPDSKELKDQRQWQLEPTTGTTCDLWVARPTQPGVAITPTDSR